MNYTLVILCGGLSSRMGSNKATLPFGSESLLEYQIRRFRPYFDRIYLSDTSLENACTPGSPSADSVHTETDCYLDCPIIRDCHKAVGPMGGLHSCLTGIDAEILFFVPVDAPFVDPAFARELCIQLESQPEFNIATIRNPEGRMQPLFTAYRREVLPTVEELIAKEIYKLMFLLRSEKTLVVDHLIPEEQFFNMNHPQDYYQALMLLARRQPECFPASYSARIAQSTTVIPVISFPARSGTGKTTYLERLLPLLGEQGIRVAIVKHDAHGFEIDKPGKDSYRLRAAGADHMVLTSRDQTAIMISHPEESQQLEDILSRISNVDLIICEGYKYGDQPKIPILRKDYCEEPIGNPSNTVAFVADFPYDTELPVFSLNDPAAILPFLLDRINRSKDK